MDKNKEKVIIILYTILSSLFIIFLGRILSLGNEALQKIFLASWFKVIQFILFIANIILIAVLSLKNSNINMPNLSFLKFFSRLKNRGNKYGDQGSAYEGNIADLDDLSGDDGFVISKNFRLSKRASYEHVVLMGPTGAGKSSTFFTPNLLDLDGSHSVVVMDPKGELHDITKEYLKSLGYDIIKLSPLKPEENDLYYNPLLIAETDTEIRKMAQSIMLNGNKSIEIATGQPSGGGEWLNMATPLLAATLTYVRELGDKKTINEALEIILSHSLDEMEAKFKQIPAAYKSFLIFKSSSESEKTISSIKSVLTTNMQIFLDENVENFTQTDFLTNVLGEKVINNKKMFNPIDLRKKPTALFICIEELDSIYMMPLMSIIYSQILNICMSNKGRPIFFFLDEFANIGIIDGMATIASTARSREIGLAVGLQGVEQLSRNYGEKNAQDILNNLKTKIAYSALGEESTKYISNIAGFTTIETKNISKESVSKSGTRRELITPDEVRRIDQDELLIIAHNKNLVRDKKNTYFTQSKYLNKIKK